MHLVLDVENTVVYTDKDKINLGPFHPDNKLVSVGYKFIETDERGYLYFYHQDLTRAPDNAAKLQSVLDKATVLIAHNIKHDVMWLEESGFSVPDQLYCTMIAEYVLLRGQKGPLDLYTLSKEKGLTHKKSELIDKYLKDKKTFAEIPIDLVTEYGEADIDSCADLFLHQQEVYSKNPGLIKTRDMMMSMCRVLTTMERNGICIDLEALAKIKKEYEEEYSTIKKEQEQIIAEVMGDTPINLDSPEQMSMVLYSRKVKDKAKWASVFNIGLNDRGKPLRRPNMSKSEFIKNVRANTEIVRKTKAEHCTTCSGKGFYTKIKKDGTPFAKSTKCRHCCGHGFIYTAGGAVAGLRLTPSNIWDVTANGFATDKETLTRLSQAVEPGSTAFRFLQNAVKLNAISTYLDSFVGGIERNVILQTGIIHPKFNQTVTATGRLSSSDPNFQNQPRGSTFPVRRAIISRFKSGTILEGDFAGLEFRVAGILSKDPNIARDIAEGVDVHTRTANIMSAKGQPTNRQEAKAHTFKPIFGGMSGSPAEQAYYREFLSLYPRLAKWHEELQDEAIKTKKIVSPSGREYAFPRAQRMPWGGSSFATQIKNYEVQGFATGDVVPIACIIVDALLKQHDLKTVLINTVHDSLMLDVYPGEEEIARTVLASGMLHAQKFCEQYYGFEFGIPLDIEMKQGPNALDLEKIDHKKYIVPIDIWAKDTIYTV